MFWLFHTAWCIVLDKGATLRANACVYPSYPGTVFCDDSPHWKELDVYWHSNPDMSHRFHSFQNEEDCAVPLALDFRLLPSLCCYCLETKPCLDFPSAAIWQHWWRKFLERDRASLPQKISLSFVEATLSPFPAYRSSSSAQSLSVASVRPWQLEWRLRFHLWKRQRSAPDTFLEETGAQRVREDPFVSDGSLRSARRYSSAWIVESIQSSAVCRERND
jgi:hypothetical protein